MNLDFLPENFATSTIAAAASMISNFTPLLIVIVGSMLAIVLIGLLIEAIRGH